ncbi:MAG: cysteine--tRNA ligase [Candidatus Niyogibacteria bacterium]|nr:cysteine--tRNA ligase [Candidatus Niyogibacteria bacterium]
MRLTLYNSLSRKKEVFEPIRDKEVGLYTCGPTVYDYAHVGNLRTYIFEDILKRALLLNDYAVRHVMNITDIGHLTSDSDEGEDKMAKALRREGKPFTLDAMKEVAEFYAAAFKKDLAKLNIIMPDIWCAASEYIKEEVALIQRLEDKGYVYTTSDGVYFNTALFVDYGKLVQTNAADIQSRIQNSEKKNPRDFALLKFNEIGWESPWGKGFPGWHIECSAMSMKHLGEQFDIHCGGIDHIPVHHTNEIAQAEAATGKKFVNFWIHGNLLIAGGKRMGKSEGNLMTLSELGSRGFHPMDYRYLVMTAHYRSPLLFSLEALSAAKSARERLYNVVLKLQKEPRDKTNEVPRANKFTGQFLEAINDDLNTPKALALLWDNIGSVSLKDLLWTDKVMGLGLNKIKEEEAPEDIKRLVEEREVLRRNKKWKETDILRRDLAEKGWIVEDTPEGPRLKRVFL